MSLWCHGNSQLRSSVLSGRAGCLPELKFKALIIGPGLWCTWRFSGSPPSTAFSMGHGSLRRLSSFHAMADLWLRLSLSGSVWSWPRSPGSAWRLGCFAEGAETFNHSIDTRDQKRRIILCGETSISSPVRLHVPHSDLLWIAAAFSTARFFAGNTLPHGRACLVPATSAVHNLHHRKHDRNLDQNADHGGECRSRVETEETDGSGNC